MRGSEPASKQKLVPDRRTAVLPGTMSQVWSGAEPQRPDETEVPSATALGEGGTVRHWREER